MKYNEIRINQIYSMKVSGKMVLVRVLHRNKMRRQWWRVKNLATGRILRVYDAGRFIEEHLGGVDKCAVTLRGAQ